MRKIVIKSNHIYEIDLLRIFTAVAVICVHSISATTYLQPNILGAEVQTLVYHTLHFSREIFMFVTGLVLVYVYYNRTYSVTGYWIKRIGAVLIPYLLWSAIYVKLNTSAAGLDYFKTFFFDSLTGSASFQLYYVVLTIQFYVCFPFLLYLFKKIVSKPWLVLSISFILQVAFYYFAFHYLENGSVANDNHILYDLSKYQNRVFFFYEFFFILGAYVAVYFEKVKAFILKYGAFMLLIFPITLVVFIWHYMQQVSVYGESTSYASSVLQPIMAFYSVIVILLLGWLVLLWGKRKPIPKGAWFIHLLAETSFGLYLVHPIFLNLSTTYILPSTTSLSIFERTVLVFLATTLASILFCLLLLYIPGLGWIIGKQLINPIEGMYKIRSKVKAIRGFEKILTIILVSVIVLLGIGGFYENAQQSVLTSATATTLKPPVENASVVSNQPLLSFAGCSANTDYTPGTSTVETIMVNKVEREYVLYIPKGFTNSQAVPLILSFHGYGSNAAQQEGKSKFDELADAKSIIIVYPQGMAGKKPGDFGWNTGLYPAIESNDVLFVSDLITQVQDSFCINPYEIYVNGFSNGAGFGNLLACRLPNRIAAFALVSGSYVTPWNECEISHPVSILEFHGMEDTTVPYDGNILKHEPPILSWAAKWGAIDGCIQTPFETKFEMTANEYTWQGCSQNADITEYSIVEGVHEWPQYALPQSDGNESIDQIIWEFFSSHILRNQLLSRSYQT